MLMNKKGNGFTIVELLVVIVVIGILATITVVLYNNVQRKAAESSLRADLSGAAKQLAVDRTFLQQYPSLLTAADDGAGIKASDGNTLTYETSENHSRYCLTASTARVGGLSFYITDDNDDPRVGSCPIAPPIAISLTRPNSYTARLEWNFTPPYNNFTYQRSTNSSFSSPTSNGSGQNMGSPTATSYILSDASVVSGTTYYYRVRANTPSGPTGWSNVLSITIP